MGLLDGPDSLIAVPDILDEDVDGNVVRRPGSPASAVQVPGVWQYGSVSEDTAGGQTTQTAAVFLCRSWPTGFAGRVVYDGRDWDVDGEPTLHGRFRGTQHWRVELRARTPRAVPGG